MAMEMLGALRQINRLFADGAVTGLSDAHLLERFVSRRDPISFEALVARHGPMVLSVCRGILYETEKSSALGQVWGRTDCPDLLRVQADGSPGLDRRILQGLVIPVHPVRPVMRPQVMPEVLHRVQLR
jgi:hypothetical protein